MAKYNRILKKKERKWMLEEILLTQIGLFNFLMIPEHLFNIRFEIENSYILGFLAFFTVSFLFYIIVFVIPPKAEELLTETYPEYIIMQEL